MLTYNLFVVRLIWNARVLFSHIILHLDFKWCVLGKNWFDKILIWWIFSLEKGKFEHFMIYQCMDIYISMYMY